MRQQVSILSFIKSKCETSRVNYCLFNETVNMLNSCFVSFRTDVTFVQECQSVVPSQYFAECI